MINSSSTPRIVTSAIGLAATVTLLSACGSDTAPAGSGGGTSSGKTVATSQADDAGSDDSASGGKSNLPASFPFPPGTKFTYDAEAAAALYQNVTVPNNDSAFAFWKQALPKAGYKIIKSGPAVGGGGNDIQFGGDKCTDTSLIAIENGRTRIECDKK